jgi:hypothetical protein
MRRIVFKIRFFGLVLLALVAGAWPMAAQAAASAGPPSLGAAASFAILASSAVTCTNSTVTGNVGVSPGTAITQTICPLTPGQIHAADQLAARAHTAFLTAYDNFRALHPCSTTVTGNPQLTGTANTLPTGVSCFGAALTMTTGTLTLQGNGPWYIEIGTAAPGALEATDFTVVSSNPCNVFWWINAGATIKATTTASTPFQGTILAGAAATVTGTTSAPSALTLTGRLLAGRVLPGAAVTVSYTNIVGCTAKNVPGTTCKPGTSTDTDENSEQSKDTEDNNKSADRASSSSNRDNNGKDSEGDSDKDAKGCDSENSKQDNSDQEMSKHDNSDQDNKKQSD